MAALRSSCDGAKSIVAHNVFEANKDRLEASLEASGSKLSDAKQCGKEL